MYGGNLEINKSVGSNANKEKKTTECHYVYRKDDES